ncbi:MAG: hypothetical protein SPI35_01865 [Porphyromonas sp.]|nr:hypothetical protein [Porphyromonas sp.]
MSGFPLLNTIISPFLADTFGIKLSKCPIDDVFSKMEPTTVVVIPSPLSSVLGNRDDCFTYSKV